jgi:AcrR family transcriptional regulator
LALMANKTEMRPQQGADAVDRAAALRNVMEVLSAKGFAKATIADLKSAVGPGFGALRKAFGTRDEILRAAIRFCADTEVCLAQEPLRVSPTGREAILSMLEENVRLRRHWPRYSGCLFMFNAFVVPQDEAELRDFLLQKRRSLSKHIRSRLARSVTEGELPAGVNCEAIANLCLTLLSGVILRVLDGAPASLLFRSIELFVKGLGFRVRRSHAGPRAARRSTPNRARNS